MQKRKKPYVKWAIATELTEATLRGPGAVSKGDDKV